MDRSSLPRPVQEDKGEWLTSQTAKRRNLCCNCRAINKFKRYRSPGIANSASYDTDLVACWHCNHLRCDKCTYGEIDNHGRLNWFKDRNEKNENGTEQYANTISNPDSNDNSSGDEERMWT